MDPNKLHTFIGKSKDGKQLFQTSAIFHQCAMQIAQGADPEMIIHSLVIVIERQSREMVEIINKQPQTYIMRIPLPSNLLRYDK